MVTLRPARFARVADSGRARRPSFGAQARAGGALDRRGRAMRLWRGQAGQTTTEWLMVAGVLTMVAVLFLNLFPGAIRSVLRALGVALKTAAP